MTAEQERSLIARWIVAGLDYRSWTVREMTWVLYRELVQDLYRSNQLDALRVFLKNADDKNNLAALDRSRMGQNGPIEVFDPMMGAGHA